jgi:heme A synthase
MSALRRLSYAAVVVAFLHIVFGAIVRISGSGMGCGDHWPKCYGYWFPPFDRPDLVIEVLHRYFAAALITVVLALLATAVLRRREPGAAGSGGVLRAAGLAMGLVTFAAAFGAVTVRFANAPWATVTHKGIAAALLAALAAATIRAGGFGGTRVLTSPTSARTARAAYVAAALAIVAVLLGGLTAKIAGGAVACRGFPLCGPGSLGGGAQHVQLTHRVVAYLLAFHLIGLATALTRRGERGPVAIAARMAAGVVAAQIALGAAMVLAGFYPVLRSLHQATGITLWLACFVMAYLARRGLGGRAPAAIRERPAPAPPRGAPVSASTGAPVRGATAVAPGTATRRAGFDLRDASEQPVRRALTAPAAVRLPLPQLAVANGDLTLAPPFRPGTPLGRGRVALPPQVRLVRGPEIVVRAHPLRRGAAPGRRRGRDGAAHPFRVIDGRARLTTPPLAQPAAPHAGRARLAASRSAAPPLPTPLATPVLPALSAPDGALMLDLHDTGPEFTIVVWSATPRPATVDAPARPSAVRTVEPAAPPHVLRNFAGASGAPEAPAPVPAPVVATAPVRAPADPAVDSPVEAPAPGAPVEEPSVEVPLEAPARELPPRHGARRRARLDAHRARPAADRAR